MIRQGSPHSTQIEINMFHCIYHPKFFYRGSFKAIHSEAEKRCSIIDHKGTATMLSEIINLVNNIIGSGIVALPSGIAAFGDAPSAIFPAIGIIWLVGAMNAYYFRYVPRSKYCQFAPSISIPYIQFFLSFAFHMQSYREIMRHDRFFKLP